MENDFGSYEKLIKEIKLKGRKLEYYLTLNLFRNEEKKIIKTLKKFQNSDGGFGKGLEADIRLPASNVASSDVAIQFLDEIKDEALKEEMVIRLIKYYESVYKEDLKGWEIVPKEVDQYPRAIWWNYENAPSFTYGNPNPEIVGFLYKYKRYLCKVDLDMLIENIVNYINGKFMEEKSQHSVVSTLCFYHEVDALTKKKIESNLKLALEAEMEKEDWNKYCLEPYLVYLSAPELMKGYEAILEANIAFNKQKIDKGLIEPMWQWNQYDEVFEKIKGEWSGLLTFRVIKALSRYENEKLKPD